MYNNWWESIGEDVGPQYADTTCTLKGTWDADQYVEATIYLADDAINDCYPETEIRLRTTITVDSITGYECIFALRGNDKYIDIVRWNGDYGDFTHLVQVDVPTTYISDGDIARCEIIGDTIRALLNGNVVAYAQDSTYSSGPPGIGIYTYGCGSSISDFGAKDFEAVDSNSGNWDLCSYNDEFTEISSTYWTETDTPGNLTVSGNELALDASGTAARRI